MTRRRGVVLAMVLALVAILGAFGAIMALLTSGASREVDALTDHLRAVGVGEAGYAAVLARLTGAPWSKRWFRTAPAVESSVSAGDGSYSYLIRDVPAAATATDPLTARTLLPPQQADLLIRATYQRSSVVMYWRLTCPQGALDGFARVLPVYFTFGPDDAKPRPTDVDPISADVNRRIEEREKNRPRFDDQRRKFSTETTLPGIGGGLGFTPPSDTIDAVDYPEGQRSDPPYLGGLDPGVGTVPAVTPPPTPAPTPTPTTNPSTPPATTPPTGDTSQLFTTADWLSCEMSRSDVPGGVKPQLQSIWNEIRDMLARIDAGQTVTPLERQSLVSRATGAASAAAAAAGGADTCR